MKRKAFCAALPYTIPICVGFLFLGMSYGFLMKSQGLFGDLSDAHEPVHLCRFDGVCHREPAPVSVSALPRLCFGAHGQREAPVLRHFHAGKVQKHPLEEILSDFRQCATSRSPSTAPVEPPEGVDRGWFMFFVTLLNHLYWVGGATLGALLGCVVQFDTTGLEFVMTALFVVMFIGQWEQNPDHRPALTGLGCSLLCLLVFGASSFILPAMALIILCLP